MKRWRTRHRHRNNKLWTWAKWWKTIDETLNKIGGKGFSKRARIIVDRALRQG